MSVEMNEENLEKLAEKVLDQTDLENIRRLAKIYLKHRWIERPKAFQADYKVMFP